MSAFRYQAIGAGGAPEQGVIEAADRRSALQLLGARGLFPSSLEANGNNGGASARISSEVGGAALAGARTAAIVGSGVHDSGGAGMLATGFFRRRVKRKEVTAFTREMAALLGAAIPIPQALDSLGEEEENPALKEVVLGLSESVKKGAAFSAALNEHPKLFDKLYVSMVRVGEEAGVLPKVMLDLAALLEQEDDVRSEVTAAVAYPLFVLGFGVITILFLLTVVLPPLFSKLVAILPVIPLPTMILLKVSGALHNHWILLLLGIAGAIGGVNWFVRTPRGALLWDGLKLRLPLMGPLFRAAALGRFARTLGTLAKSGVSLLPALKIVENTIGNLVLAQQVARVAEETRGGDSLATPLRRLGIFPKTVVQMIAAGEESGKLDEMLLKVADIEERHMRARMKTLISLLAPFLILVVGALVGFMVIAILLPIFKMSSAIR